MGVLTGCKPREEVLHGDLKDAIFAADFGEVIAGKAPDVYGDADLFFRNTHPTQPLRKVVAAIFSRLASSKEPGGTIRLSTGYGGGKTHALIALYHLACHVGEPGVGSALLAAAMRPGRVHVVAADAHRSGAVFARHDDIEVKSLWGEVAYGLLGKGKWRQIGMADDAETQPDEELLLSWFPKGPVLVLLDELVTYLPTLSERGRYNGLAFLTKLVSIAARRPQTVLVVTDPARQAIYAGEAARLGSAIKAGQQEAEKAAEDKEQAELAAARQLDDLFSRQVSDFDPIGNEAAQVIIRRLFESVDDSAKQGASAQYHGLYTRVAADREAYLPTEAASQDYARRIVECYPFHPRLVDTARHRLGALQDFQKSRGVLRLFGRIIRDIWETNEDVKLITAGDINWSSERIQGDLLNRLHRQELKAAVQADIELHAGELDGGPSGLHRRVASALLLESLPAQDSAGMDEAEVTLAVLRPEEAGPEPARALHALADKCWHLFPLASGRGYQFRFEENINKRLEERVAEVKREDAWARVQATIQGFFSGAVFKPCAWPDTARMAADDISLKLALCETEELARSICKNAEDSDPKAPVPRRYINAIVAVAPTPAMLENAITRARAVIAAEGLSKEYGTDARHRLSRDQLKKLQPTLERNTTLEARRAFNIVVIARGRAGRMEEEHQADEDVLRAATGQAALRSYLDKNKLIFGKEDSLDPGMFAGLLKGATGMDGVYTTRAAHERIVAAPDLPLIAGPDLIQRTIQRAVKDGQVVLKLRDGGAYDAKGAVLTVEGRRRRRDGEAVSLPPLDEATLIALPGSAAAEEWLREDPIGAGEQPRPPWTPTTPGDPPFPPPPTPGTSLAQDWDRAVELAAGHALTELRLTAQKPADGDALLRIAQPLSADTLVLKVSVNGELKTGGHVDFVLLNVKPGSAVKPLDTARTFANALAAAGEYEAVLTLQFGTGRAGMDSALLQAREQSPGDVTVLAKFARADA